MRNNTQQNRRKEKKVYLSIRVMYSCWQRFKRELTVESVCVFLIHVLWVLMDERSHCE